MLVAIGSRSASPVFWRSSVSSAIPASTASRGEPIAVLRPETSTSPESIGSSPKIARHSSVRPAPTSPASPTISPARSVKLMSSSFPRRVKCFDPQQLVSRRNRIAPVDRRDFAPDHAVDDLRRRHLRERAGVHGPPVAQDRDPVADRAQLLEPMRDVDDAHLALAQRPHDAEHFLRLGVGKRRSGLVENEQARTMLDRAADLDQLLGGRAQLLDAPIGVERKMVFGDQPPRASRHLAAFHPAQRRDRLPTQEYVLRHGKVRREQRFLMHHRNPDRSRLGRRVEPHLAAIPQHLPPIRLDHPGDDLHERRLARSVFAQQQMSFSRVHREISIRQSLDRAELFLDALQLEKHAVA